MKTPKSLKLPVFSLINLSWFIHAKTQLENQHSLQKFLKVCKSFYPLLEEKQGIAEDQSQLTSDNSLKKKSRNKEKTYLSGGKCVETVI